MAVIEPDDNASADTPGAQTYREQLDEILRLNRRHVVIPPKMGEVLQYLLDCWDAEERFNARNCARLSQRKKRKYRMCERTARRLVAVLVAAGVCVKDGPSYAPAKNWPLGIARINRKYREYSEDRHAKNPHKWNREQDAEKRTGAQRNGAEKSGPGDQKKADRGEAKKADREADREADRYNTTQRAREAATASAWEPYPWWAE